MQLKRRVAYFILVVGCYPCLMRELRMALQQMLEQGYVKRYVIGKDEISCRSVRSAVVERIGTLTETRMQSLGIIRADCMHHTGG